MKTYFSKIAVGVYFKDSKGVRYLRVGSFFEDGDKINTYAGRAMPGNSFQVNAVMLEDAGDFTRGCLVQFTADEYVETFDSPLN